MVKHFFLFRIPLYAIILIIGALAAAVAMIGGRYREIIYDYNVYIPAGDKQPPEFKTYGSWPELENSDFFAKVKRQFIDSKATFIEADLSQMKVRFYQDGAAQQEIPILTKGREGSWWETPAGLYRIETKEKDHFSSFGRVHQPYSMEFQGNFFIHGWPYYSDGTPVATTYSGGCIRLSTENAKTLFGLVKVGTPVLVYKKDFSKDDFSYAFKTPELSSTHYLAADISNNFIFLGKGQSDVVPVASLAKLVTALVATEYINLDDVLTVNKEDLVFTSLPRLKEGQKISAYNLLYPLLMESSNEAGFVLARHLGHKRFVVLMNQKAKALGMAHTTFADPAGMKAENVSTAEDLFALSQYLYNNRSFILNMSAGRIKNSAYGPSEFTDLKNLNVFDADPRFMGGKVGESTAAKQTILSVFKIEFGSSTRPVVFIALNSENREADAKAMLEYVTNRY